jgi:hypothetical protein
MHVNGLKVRQHLLRKQHLHPETYSDDLVGIVGDLVGLHATVIETPYLSLHQRSKDFRREDLNREMYERFSLGKIRSIRKTLFIFPKEFIPTAFQSTAHINQRISEQYMVRKGIDLQSYDELSTEILNMCKGRELTVPQIKEDLGLKIDVYAILNLMCDRGNLIRGRPWRSWQDKTQTYRVFSEVFPHLELSAVEDERAVSQLIEGYIRSYGPAHESDLIWWTGLPKKTVAKALINLEDKLSIIPSQLPEEPFLMVQEDFELLKAVKQPKKDIYNFLPVLDSFLMGYRDRSRFLKKNHQEFVLDRSGNLTSVVLENGEVMGVWDRETGPSPAIKVFFFRTPSKQKLRRILSHMENLGVFIFDQEVPTVICDEMVPLTQRTAGSMLRPLKDCKPRSV